MKFVEIKGLLGTKPFTAKRGKSSMGWFYGFKLHLIIHEKEKIFAFHLSQGNVDDRIIKVVQELTKNIFGKLFETRVI
ncbi:transposase [Aquirufa sp. 1-SAACH-A3]|uniref:Transposase n=1 Tax=Aquirufa salirivi TaxID=3104729 RepID=A0ABW8RQB6_9BACT